MISNTSTPPYYAVIFSSIRTNDNKGYSEMNALMNELALRHGEIEIESSHKNLVTKKLF